MLEFFLDGDRLVGIGQEALPFGRSLVDKTVLVMSPDYGSRLQLQKIVMLDRADLVVINKSDLPGARTAMVEVEQRLSSNRRGSISPSPPSATSPGEGRGLEGGEGHKRDTSHLAPPLPPRTSEEASQ